MINAANLSNDSLTKLTEKYINNIPYVELFINAGLKLEGVLDGMTSDRIRTDGIEMLIKRGATVSSEFNIASVNNKHIFHLLITTQDIDVDKENICTTGTKTALHHASLCNWLESIKYILYNKQPSVSNVLKSIDIISDSMERVRVQKRWLLNFNHLKKYNNFDDDLAESMTELKKYQAHYCNRKKTVEKNAL